MGKRRLRTAFTVVLGLVGAAALATAALTADGTIASGLDDPRGIAAVKGGHTLVVQTATGVVSEIDKKGKISTVVTVPGAVDIADDGPGDAYVVTGGPPPEEGGPTAAAKKPAGDPPPASLLRVSGKGKDGKWEQVADIGAYQVSDPDPDDLEETPEESNPNGLAILKKDQVLVTDAANNDLLLIDTKAKGKDKVTIETVARFKTELVPWPFGPPGGMAPAEAVPTSVAVGPDGAWYVSELKGFPFAAGTSRIWRIEPGARNAVCDPAAPQTGPCRTFATGFSSVIDIAFGKDGTLYVLEIAKDSLFAVEILGQPPIGALIAVKNGVHTELAPGTLMAPGGVAVGEHGSLDVTTGTVFGPGGGSVVRITP